GGELAERGRRPADRAIAERFAAILYVLLHEPEEARAHAERTLAACAEEPDPVSEAVATMLCGWALAETGAAAEGLAALREGLGGFLATGQRLILEGGLGRLGHAHARGGAR